MGQAASAEDPSIDTNLVLKPSEESKINIDMIMRGIEIDSLEEGITYRKIVKKISSNINDQDKVNLSRQQSWVLANTLKVK